ncbi:MAG: HAMP domain-containing sensor histidine kinase [Candidatus Nomurabacteria bacterium]|nr:HAMP domain-containing sensor histidine kinase [Candidatus Nomurabacteria bacterium]
MEKLYKQFEVLVIKWSNDRFFIARIKLTFFNFLTAFIILVSASVVLYRSFLFNITDSITNNVFDPHIARLLIDRTQDILQTRLIITNVVILLIVIVFGFLLTKKTLNPIKDSMQRQKRFIADASHELRTPIAIAISGLEVAINNKHINLDTAKHTLHKTLEEMQDMSLLTNNLLDITKYNINGPAERELFLMNEIISSVISKIEPIAIKKDIEIKNEIKEQAFIYGNKIELMRVVSNILNNAINHTPQKGNIVVSDSINKKDYFISIKDTGVGISKDLIDKIFDPFFQGDVSRSSGGTGLGLTLVKQIVENHDGVISIKSELNKGTIVNITLPLSS